MTFPLLLELARADATAAQLTNEGFEPWEIMEAKAIVDRERANSSLPLSPAKPVAAMQSNPGGH